MWKLYARGFAHYSDYLASDHWRAFKAQFQPRQVRNGKPVCEFCFAGDVGLELHHKTYKRLGREKRDDVVLVCAKCHEWIHRRRRASGKSIRQATRYVEEKARRRRKTARPLAR